MSRDILRSPNILDEANTPLTGKLTKGDSWRTGLGVTKRGYRANQQGAHVSSRSLHYPRVVWVVDIVYSGRLTKDNKCRRNSILNGRIHGHGHQYPRDRRHRECTQRSLRE